MTTPMCDCVACAFNRDYISAMALEIDAQIMGASIVDGIASGLSRKPFNPRTPRRLKRRARKRKLS